MVDSQASLTGTPTNHNSCHTLNGDTMFGRIAPDLPPRIRRNWRVSRPNETTNPSRLTFKLRNSLHVHWMASGTARPASFVWGLPLHFRYMHSILIARSLYSSGVSCFSSLS
jgi:hypothetical protein